MPGVRLLMGLPTCHHWAVATLVMMRSQEQRIVARLCRR